MGKKNSKKKKRGKKSTVGRANRQYKDTIFADLFGNDIYAEDNVISLVNALYGTNLKKGQVRYQKEKLESVLRVTDLKNDVSFMLDDKLLVLFEHQSTVNENMPLRCLLYCAEFYKRLMPSNDYFNRLKLDLPMPQFFVFYNGNERYKDDCILRLSDSFMLSESASCAKELIDKSHSHLELTVRMININSDKNHKILANCSVLRQYSQFVQLMKEQGLRYGNKQETRAQKEQREKENLEKMKYVVDYCKEKSILKDYFDRKGGEVYAMLRMEYSREYEVECTKQLIQKWQRKAEEEKAKAEEEKARAEEEKARADKAEEVTNDLYVQVITLNIAFINLGKDVEELRPIAGCTEPYIEQIYQAVKENPNITPQELYDSIIKDDIENIKTDSKSEHNEDEKKEK